MKNMKNFTELEEKQLITKIWKVHDEIFSMPAKWYIFCIIDGPMIGCAGFAYMFIDENKNNGVNYPRLTLHVWSGGLEKPLASVVEQRHDVAGLSSETPGVMPSLQLCV